MAELLGGRWVLREKFKPWCIIAQLGCNEAWGPCQEP